MAAEVRFLTIAGECAGASEAFNFLQNQPVDLVLLDIEMPGMSGLELIQTLGRAPMFILVSSKPEYALEGFELKVIDFLVKPVSFPRFLTAVQRAYELFELRKSQPTAEDEKSLFQPEFLFARVNNQLVRIDYQDILYAQALGDYVLLVTPGKKYPVHLTLKVMEERLPTAQFARVHRSYIVAVSKVNFIEENSIQINKEIIPLSESYRASFLKKINLV